MIHNGIRQSPWLSEVASAGNPHIKKCNTMCYNSWSITPLSLNTQMLAGIGQSYNLLCFHPPKQTLVLEQTALKHLPIKMLLLSVVIPQHKRQSSVASFEFF